MRPSRTRMVSMRPYPDWSMGTKAQAAGPKPQVAYRHPVSHVACRLRLKRIVMRVLDASVLRLCVTSFCATILVSGCSHAPPADFAPDPGLVAQIRDIRIVTSYARACPGSVIAASYEAVLASGERVTFARSYDKKHPPRLHVVFLDRESPDAVSQEDGDWVTERDPLATVSTGFRLTATLRANSHVTSTVVVPPYYGCMPHTFTFSGEPGGAGAAGGNGPGGTGGRGGKGGKGQTDQSNRRCPDAADGPQGRAGGAGPAGSEGTPGPRSIVVTAPTRDIFGVQVPPGLGALLERLQRRP